MKPVIVVGVDGSTTAQKAAESAHELAVALQASLHVVAAFEGNHEQVLVSGADAWVVSDEASAERVARAVRSSLGEQVALSSSAVRGKPAEALIREAVRLGARIIVVGNRRVRGIGRVLGSVANSVAHNSPCDVYIANTYE